MRELLVSDLFNVQIQDTQIQYLRLFIKPLLLYFANIREATLICLQLCLSTFASFYSGFYQLIKDQYQSLQVLSLPAVRTETKIKFTTNLL